MKTLNKYKTVIFDLDGTLLDTLDDLHNAVNHTMDVYGYPHKSREEVRSFVGNGVDKLIELCLPDGADDKNLVAAIAEYRRYYNENSQIKTKPYDGVIEVIDKLISGGINVAVVSNKIHKSTVELCKKYFPRIENVFGEREAEGIRRKPYPDMVINAAETIGTATHDCVYVGDSEVDVETAANARMDCILVLWGFRDKDFLVERGGKKFASSARELLDLIVNSCDIE
ncbi:MAG: HAD family hydrolase [Ruminococcaceae bacterium]|nr:HAD family hydrolase [Oscillospiraceae bacterium]